MELIIKETDPRYHLLNKLWEEYSWSNLVSEDDYLKIYYFIPPELVLRDGYFTRGYTLFDSKSKFTDDWSNWFSSKIIGRRLLENCELSIQDYFDLLILKINDRNERSTCDQCGGPMQFSGRIYYGYNGTTRWIDHNHQFCSKSCSAKYLIDNYEEFGYSREDKIRKMVEGSYDPYNKTRHDFICWLKDKDPNERCYLYIARLDDQYKFGVTKNPWKRSRYFNQSLEDLEVVYESTRLKVGLLEAHIKLRNQGLEVMNDKDRLLSLIHEILANRPLANPFE